MNSIHFIDYKKCRILLIEFNNLYTQEDVLGMLAQAEAYISKQPLNSLYTLTTIGDFDFDSTIVAAFRDYVLHNTPYVLHAAVVGLEDFRQMIYDAVTTASGRDFVLFSSTEEAKEYLHKKFIEDTRSNLN